MGINEIIPETADEKSFFTEQQNSAPEPEPAPQPEPERQPDQHSDSSSNEGEKIDTVADQKQRFVPHEALHEERVKRQALQQTVDKMEQRFRELQERLMQPKAEHDPRIKSGEADPDPETDPIEYIKAKGKQFDELTAQQQRQAEQQQQMAAFQRRVMSAENEFRANQPDYDAAVKHAINAMNEDLLILGYRDPQYRASVIEQEVISLAQRNFEAGENPAKAIFEYAKRRGYGSAHQKANDLSAQQQIAQTAAKQRAARSPGAVNGAPPETITLESLSHMSDEEFDANFDKLWKNS